MATQQQIGRAQKRDDEFSVLILVNILFTLALIYVDCWYNDWDSMFKMIWPAIFAGILHALVIAAWLIVVKEWQDPNFDIMRKWLLALIVATLLMVAGFRAYRNETNQVLIDSRENVVRDSLEHAKKRDSVHYLQVDSGHIMIRATDDSVIYQIPSNKP